VAFLGAVFTALVCWSAGRLILRRLRIELRPPENALLSFIAGAPILSAAVFLLCTLRLATFTAFAILGFGIVAISIAFAGLESPIRIAAPARSLAMLAAALFAFYGIVYLANSLAPEFSPDGTAYHLALVTRYFRSHGFSLVTTNMYANLSQGLEMLFLYTFAFGGHSAASTLHCFFLFALPLLIICWGRRIGRQDAGLCAAMLCFLSPLAGIDGVSAYNDVALAAFGFALFLVVEIWREEKRRNLALLAGLLAGFCFAIKYTGVVAVLYVLAILRTRSLPALVSAAAVITPWMIKNAVFVHNPLSPFFNALFPNPYIHISFEHSYREYLSRYGLRSLRPLFWIVTVTGRLGGQIGPVFLLAPVALLSLRSKFGRRVLLAALFFLAPYPQNIGARFLLPALPFIALAIALALDRLPILLFALTLSAAILAWPRVIDRYRAPAGGWQIATVPWKAALHFIPPRTWLTRYPDYRLAEAIDRAVPPGKRVWSTMALAESYIRPEVLVNYYSAEGEKIQDMLLTPVRADLQPLWRIRFSFSARRVTSVRIIQTAGGNDIWSIGEARFFHGMNEVSPNQADASPFPWDIGLALDRNPVTRWRSWEPIRPGMHIDFRFENPVDLDRVELDCSHDQWQIQLKLDGIDAQATKDDLPPRDDLRALAMRTVQSRRIDYLMIGNDFPASADMASAPARWNLETVARQESGVLYAIR
jgi:hypothetical protein